MIPLPVQRPDFPDDSPEADARSLKAFLRGLMPVGEVFIGGKRLQEKVSVRLLPKQIRLQAGFSVVDIHVLDPHQFRIDVALARAVDDIFSVAMFVVQMERDAPSS